MKDFCSGWGSYNQVWDLRGRESMTFIGMRDVFESCEANTHPVSAPVKILGTTRRLLQRLPVLREESDQRVHALKRFKYMIMYDLDATRMGQSLATLATRVMDDQELRQSFADSFRSKATSTLQKRCGSLEKYFLWALNHGCESPWSASEQVIYDYVKTLREDQQGPTSARHFLEAIRFLHSVAIFRNMLPEQVLSARVRGVAQDMFLKKRPKKQASELTVAMTADLEDFCCGAVAYEACISGQLLFCLHSGARWSDAQRLRSIELQMDGCVVLIVAMGLSSKTTMTEDAKTTFLPYVAIGSGIKHAWGSAWLAARKECRLTLDDFTLPSWREATGDWAAVPMSSSEATIWLWDFLMRKQHPEETLQRISSHSCKATLPTWTARSSVVKFTSAEQRLVGHHVKPKDRSPLTYSRQSYTSLYGKILSMFRTIQSGRYEPDLSEVQRILRVANEFDAPGGEESLRAERSRRADGLCDDDQSGAMGDSEGSEDSSSGSEEAHRVPAAGNLNPARRCRAPFDEPVQAGEVFVHRVSGIVHCLKDGPGGVEFYCGRVKTCAYNAFEEAGAAAEDPDCCIQCSRARDGRRR